MSIGFMALAWKTNMPSGRKLVLLALCDNANNQGECYPSVDAISRKCSMGQRTVQQHISDLEAAAILTRHFRSGRSTVYKIDPRNFCLPAGSAPVRNSHPTSTKPACLPLQIPDSSPASPAPIIINEPSKDPSPKRQMVRGTRLAPTWKLPEAWIEWALQQQPTWTAEHVRFVADKFRDHWIGLPGQRGVKADWLATWRNWCRNEQLVGDDRIAGQSRWWSSDTTIIATGVELGLTPLPGESMSTFKGRVQQVLNKRGEWTTVSSSAAILPLEGLMNVPVSSTNRVAALNAARALRSPMQAKTCLSIENNSDLGRNAPNFSSLAFTRY